MIERLLEALTVREREIVRLRYGIGDNRSFHSREVAAIMNTSEVGLVRELATAVTKLRNQVAGDTTASLTLRKCGISTTGEVT